MPLRCIEKEGVVYLFRDEFDMIVGSEIIVDRQYETPETPPPGSVFIDIGCCHGVWSCLMSKRVTNAKLLCIDPMPVNCELTRLNLEQNGHPTENQLILQAAVGRGSCMEFQDCMEGGGRLNVPVMTLGHLLDAVKLKWGSEDVFTLKSDCEGGEYGFVETMTQSDANHIHWFVGEQHSGVSDSYDLEPRLNALGFKKVTSSMEHLFKYKRA